MFVILDNFCDHFCEDLLSLVGNRSTIVRHVPFVRFALGVSVRVVVHLLSGLSCFGRWIFVTKNR